MKMVALTSNEAAPPLFLSDKSHLGSRKPIFYVFFIGFLIKNEYLCSLKSDILLKTSDNIILKYLKSTIYVVT